MPLQRVDELRGHLDQLMKRQLIEGKMALTTKRRLLTEYSPLRQLGLMKQKLTSTCREIEQKVQTGLLLKRERLSKFEEKLYALDPRNVLKRGYSILLAQNENSVIVSSQQLKQGDHLRALLADGERELIVHDGI
ncbi:hypothetical protein EBT16_14970 [bacterium]|nr:hypothetical protein [bacterium]